jgi:protocatechuate 3,4-dioxygenase beta subunit
VGLALIATAGLGAALAQGDETSPGGTTGCPSSNPPNEMTLVAGTPQTATLGNAFATAFQVALTNSDGCPVTSAAAGVPVTFAAPSSGASGVFSASASNTAVVGADASGAVAAPPFTANTVAGDYAVTAISRYGSVSFSLTNTAAGIPARIVAIPPVSRSASVTSRYRQPLQVEVLDAGGEPIAGATVTFTLTAATAGACGSTSSSGAGATFAGGGTTATATTGASGVASSPALTANATAGSFTATAAVAGEEPAGGSGRESPGTSGVAAASAATFSLSNVPGRPAKLTPGVGAMQSTPAGTRFPIALAVTVTDAQKNPVAGALVTFSAPLAGASGRFALRAHDHRRARTVRVETDACGIAVAPAFTAGDAQGGYVVKASAKHARPAAFALVNEAPGRS